MSSAPVGGYARRGASAMIAIGRVFLTLAFLALLGAWITELSGRPLMGMSQQHLFSDAIVLALLGIASQIDAFWHARNR